MTERLEWVNGPDAPAALTTSTDELADSPFVTWAWLEAWRRAFAPDATWRGATAWRDGRVVGLPPPIERGGRLSAPANEHTPVFRPLARDAAALQTVMRGALRAAGGMLTLPSLPAADPLLGAPRGGWRGLSTPAAHSPIVETAGPFAD